MNSNRFSVAFEREWDGLTPIGQRCQKVASRKLS